MGAEQLNSLLAFWNDFRLTCKIFCRREKWTACWSRKMCLHPSPSLNLFFNLMDLRSHQNGVFKILKHSELY